MIARLQTEAMAKAKLTPFKLTEEQNKFIHCWRNPHLDGGYTVFGEVIEGLSVIDSIAAQPTGPKDRPVKDIKMEIKVIKNNLIFLLDNLILEIFLIAKMD